MAEGHKQSRQFAHSFTWLPFAITNLYKSYGSGKSFTFTNSLKILRWYLCRSMGSRCFYCFGFPSGTVFTKALSLWPTYYSLFNANKEIHLPVTILCCCKHVLVMCSTQVCDLYCREYEDGCRTLIFLVKSTCTVQCTGTYKQHFKFQPSLSSEE